MNSQESLCNQFWDKESFIDGVTSVQKKTRIRMGLDWGKNKFRLGVDYK